MHDPVGQRIGLRLRMGDIEDRRARLRLDPRQMRQNFVLARLIEVGERFIHDE